MRVPRMQAPVQSGGSLLNTLAPEDREIERFLASPGEETFRGACEWLAPRLLRYFRSRGCDEAVAEELTQDVLFAVFRHSASLRDRALFRGWLYKVAKNALLMRVRRERRTVDVMALDDARETARAASPETGSFAEIVAGLAPDEREILTLRYVDDLDYGEIAAALEIPVGTAKWRVFNCKTKLAVQLRRWMR